jgi:Flp pilus assembly protein TadG
MMNWWIWAAIFVGRFVRVLQRMGLADARANTALVFAGALPVLIGTAGLAFDFGTLAMKRSALQAAADQAATAAAKQMALASSTDSNIKSAAASYIVSDLKEEDAQSTVTVTIDHSKSTVNVQLTENWTPFFAHFVAANITPIVVGATAALQGENRLCILSLNGTDNQAFRMMNSSSVQAPSCGVYSNSTDAKGMVLQNSSVITAAVICSAGGVSAAKSQTNVTPQTDCPLVPDPLASRLAPPFGGCDQNNLVIKSGSVTLNPGVYCGGLTITKTATVQFQPGTYIIKDGPLSLLNNAAVSGTDVGFYLSGPSAILDFNGNATIDLSGAESGDLAGMLFFADRAQPDGTTHKINAANVKSLTGTIYLPSGDLQINHNAAMLGGSAYTAIIANRFRIAMGPTLVMNTNYGATKVPVPDGVRSAATVVLTN